MAEEERDDEKQEKAPIVPPEEEGVSESRMAEATVPEKESPPAVAPPQAVAPPAPVAQAPAMGPQAQVSGPTGKPNLGAVPNLAVPGNGVTAAPAKLPPGTPEAAMWTKASNVHNPFLRVLAKVGAAGYAGARGAESPEERKLQDEEFNRKQDQPLTNAQKTAAMGREIAETGKTEAETNKINNPVAEPLSGEENVRQPMDAQGQPTGPRERAYKMPDGSIQWSPEGQVPSVRTTSPAVGGANSVQTGTLNPASPQSAMGPASPQPQPKEAAPVQVGGVVGPPAVGATAVQPTGPGAVAPAVAAPRYQYGKPPAAREPAKVPEQALNDLLTGDNGKPRINPDTGKPFTGANEAATYLKKEESEAANPDRKPVTPQELKTASDTVGTYHAIPDDTRQGLLKEMSMATTKGDLQNIQKRADSIEESFQRSIDARNAAASNKNATVSAARQTKADELSIKEDEALTSDLASTRGIREELDMTMASGNQMALNAAMTRFAEHEIVSGGIKRFNETELRAMGPDAGSWFRQAQTWYDKGMQGQPPAATSKDILPSSMPRTSRLRRSTIPTSTASTTGCSEDPSPRDPEAVQRAERQAVTPSPSTGCS